MRKLKERMTITLDAAVLKRLDQERGDLIPRSAYANHVLIKGLLAIKKEQEALSNSEEEKVEI